MIKTAVLKPAHTSVNSVHTSTIMFTIKLITCKWHSGIIYSTEMTKPTNQACLCLPLPDPYSEPVSKHLSVQL